MTTSKKTTAATKPAAAKTAKKRAVAKPTVETKPEPETETAPKTVATTETAKAETPAKEEKKPITPGVRANSRIRSYYRMSGNSHGKDERTIDHRPNSERKLPTSERKLQNVVTHSSVCIRGTILSRCD